MRCDVDLPAAKIRLVLVFARIHGSPGSSG